MALNASHSGSPVHTNIIKPVEHSGEFLFHLSRETLMGSSFRRTTAASEAITAFVKEHNRGTKPVILEMKEVKCLQFRGTVGI